jgi:hypothetical protein
MVRVFPTLPTLTEFGISATEPAPIATELLLFTEAPSPMAMPPSDAMTDAFVPIAMPPTGEPPVDTAALDPMAMEFVVACEFEPTETLLSPPANAEVPTATLFTPLEFEPVPSETEFVFA